MAHAAGMEPGEPPQRDIKESARASRNVAAAPAPQRDNEPAAPAPRNVAAPPESIAAGTASGQGGAIAWRQLRASEVTEAAIKHRAHIGHLHRVHRGVYIVGHKALASTAREHAALLACGPRALVSHWSAAHLWRLIETPPEEIHVTLVGRRCRARAGIRLHTTGRLAGPDIRRRDGLPLTAPARTLVDLAAHTNQAELERLVAEARVLELLSARDLDKVLARAGPRPGVAAMRRLLDAEQGPSLTRSEAERELQRLTKEAGLPTPQTNARVAGYEVDFLWPVPKVIVEVDGFRFHGHRRAFESDRKKGLALAATGYRVIRITWRQLVDEPVHVAVRLAQALANGS